MPDVSKDLILLIQYLAPGFIFAWIFYGLTHYTHPSSFERVVQAIIYSLIVDLINKIPLFPPLPNGYQNVSSFIIAIVLGFLVAFLTNNDSVHAILRKLKLFNTASYPSTFIGAFAQNSGCYILLNFKDGRRLLGYLQAWPLDSEKGYFFITDYIWCENSESE